MSKHTPGPWIADEFFMEEGRSVRVGTNDGTSDYYHRSVTICECWVKNSDDDDDVLVPQLGRAEANARLISAAPELLDNCIKALAAWEGSGPPIMLDDLRAVISKATGEQPTEDCSDCHGTGERYRKEDDAPMTCWCEYKADTGE